jgi:O-antigen/teichoic acid export membrane protein
VPAGGSGIAGRDRWIRCRRLTRRDHEAQTIVAGTFRTRVTSGANETAATPEPRAEPRKGLVLRNTLWLVFAQLVGMPLSFAMNAAMARYLGPKDFGYTYLAWTYLAFGFLAVECGQSLAVPAMIASRRDRVGEIIGSALAWRLPVAVLVYAMLAAASVLFGYTWDFQVTLFLAAFTFTLGTWSSICQAALQGYERTDLVAFNSMAQQLLLAMFVVPTLVLGGGLRGTLLAQATAFAVFLIFATRSLRKIWTGVPRVRFTVLKELFMNGYPFMFMGLAMALQPSVDAVFLARFGSPDSVGWFAVARKLMGILVFPVVALVSALYPTLCRLYATDSEGFRKTTVSALRTATILVIPVAAGCALFPDIGISIFSKASFGPAEDDLRLLAPFLFLVYFTMVLGTCITAIGKKHAWSVTQCLCILVSVVLDPFLVPWFQQRTGNGGLGVCVSSVLSEILMLVMGLWLMPPGIIDRALGRILGVALLSGGVMALVAKLLSDIPSVLAAAASVAAYAGCLYLFKGIDEEQLQAIKGLVDRKRRG